MIKHPAFRVQSITQVAPEILDEFLADLKNVADASPLRGLLTDYEVVGSYARGAAQLHSDIDINLATPSPELNLAIRAGFRANAEATSVALENMQDVWDKWGLRIDISLQHWTAKVTPKMCFSLPTKTLYGTETRRFDILPDGSIRYRPTNPNYQPKFSVSIWDDVLGDFRDFDPMVDDPWASELDTWRQRYGANFLEFGVTAETQHMEE